VLLTEAEVSIETKEEEGATLTREARKESMLTTTSLPVDTTWIVREQQSDHHNFSDKVWELESGDFGHFCLIMLRCRARIY
jgi:hypothetical protein